jgi:2-hydroxy-6-oxonona-2,4-dienedioate hydrolase
MSVPTIWTELMGTGVSERFYDAAGVRTRVLEGGDGPTLLLLHGTGGHAEAYYRNLPELSRHFRVCAVDMLGHGFTDRPDVEYTLDDYASHIADLLDAMGVERASLSGESLGAAVSAWFGITRPERIERAVLNTGILHLPDRLPELLDLGKRTRAIAEQGLTRESIRARMEWLVSKPERMTDELVEIRYRIYSQDGMMERVGRIMQRMMMMLSGKVGHEYMAEGVMQKLTCPTLVLWTEHNPGQSVELATSVVEEMPDARIHVLKDAGHWPQFEKPELVNQLHLEFLAATPAA